MNKGLASILISDLLKLLQPCASHKSHELDHTAKLAILNSVSIALNLKDLVYELEAILTESNLIGFILGKSTDHLAHSAEALQVLQRIAKNYPQHLLDSYDTFDFNAYLTPLLGASDRKRVASALKILEEWVKSYKSESLVSGEAGGEAGNESDDEEVKGETLTIAKSTPY